MGYATVNELINDAVSFYNDTDALTYNVPESTRRRILHYIQRTADEIWYYRPWNFKILTVTFYATGGSYQLPFNFATIGPKGGLFESDTKLMWTECDYQEWLALRQRSGVYGQNRIFTIGNDIDLSVNTLGEGSGGIGAQRSILFPDPAEVRAFILYYEGTPPKMGWDVNLDALDYAQPIPLPEGFHNTLLLGTIAKLQESKGDPRPAFRSEYVASLAQAAAQHLPLTSRMQQLPRAIPGGQW